MSDGRDDNRAALVVDEAMLHAYADGQLDATRQSLVEAWLAEHGETAEQVREWQAQNAALRAAFDPILEQPIPARLAALGQRQPRSLARHAWLAAAGLALFALGGTVGWLAPLGNPWSEQPVHSGFVADATAAYKLYAVEVRHPVEVGADQETHLVAWLSKRLGSKLIAPRLGEMGFHLVGGRLLPAGQIVAGQSAPAAMLMYEDAAGRRVTCYVVTNPDNRETAFQFRQVDGVSTFFWLDHGLSYALSGEVDREKLLALAQEVYRQLD